eukprot:3855080-Amphidinium_carterae.2
MPLCNRINNDIYPLLSLALACRMPVSLVKGVRLPVRCEDAGRFKSSGAFQTPLSHPAPLCGPGQ